MTPSPVLHNHFHIRVARTKKENCRQAGIFKKLFFLPRKRVTLDRKVLPLGQFPSDLIRCATYIEVCGALNTTKATELEFLSYTGLYLFQLEHNDKNCSIQKANFGFLCK